MKKEGQWISNLHRNMMALMERNIQLNNLKNIKAEVLNW